MKSLRARARADLTQSNGLRRVAFDKPEKLENVLERLGTTEDTTPAVKREEGGKNPTGPLFYFVDGIDCRTALAD